mmetsp:Transcript_114047/g.271518  ORF Transcript_114047/g.271518 Transcript_114047/m.271518 type:complete len:207 (+) Transcript_114047:1426-2046(+)
MSVSRWRLCSSASASGSSSSAASSSAASSGFASLGGSFSKSTNSCEGLNSICRRLDSCGANVQHTGVAFKVLSSYSGISKLMDCGTLDTLVTITDSRLLEFTGMEARSSLVSENSRAGERPWPVQGTTKSLAQRSPVMTLKMILWSISVADSGLKTTVTCLRSPGKRVPKMPSPPPSTTAIVPGPASRPPQSSSSNTSAGTSSMLR